MLIPVLIASFCLETKGARYIAIGIFVFASITDYIDGVLARKWAAHSNFGRMLDPIADKMLVASTLLMMVDQGIAPAIPIVAILCREIFVSGMREYLAESKIVIKVSLMGKCKTGLQMLAIILLLWTENLNHGSYIKIMGLVALWGAALLTIISGYIYVKESFKHI